MFKKLDSILNTIMATFVGVFIGHSIYKYYHYIKFPDLYKLQSTPCYTSIIIYGIITAILLTISAILKSLIKQKKNSNE